MPAPLLTTNPAEFSKLEGVYIDEKDPPGFVRGINLNNVGIFGTCVRGPVDQAVSITSESRFFEVFGGRDNGAGGAITSEVWKALLGKPFGQLYIVRCAAAAAVKASFTLESATAGGGTQVGRIDASSVGTWGNSVQWKISAASSGVSNAFNLTIRYLGKDTVYKNIDQTTDSGDNSLTVIGDDLGNLITYTKLTSTRPVNSTASTDGADADGFTNLGESVASFTSVAGTDGSIAASDYSGTGKGLNLLMNKAGIGVIFCANEDGTITATVNAAILTALSSTTAPISDRVFCIHEGALTGSPVVVATIAADAASFRSDRIIYCHNAIDVYDPEAGVNIQAAPNSLMASILSQIDVDIHPGEESTKRFTGGVKGLDDESMSRADYITLRDAGVCSLEKDGEGGYLFVSGVTTLLTPGKTEIARRRSADFLQVSVANRLRFFVKKKNTAALRAMIGGEVGAFLRTLQLQGRVVEEFAIDQASQNTAAQRAQGLEYVLMRVKLIGHALFIVLTTEIGTGVVIETT